MGVLLLGMVGALADPIVCTAELTPPQLTAPGQVRVSVNVANMSEDGTTISVTLFDPAGNVCSSFGSGGTANLVPGGSQIYNGTWDVTQQELDAGKVIFQARYSLTDANGRMPVNRPIAADIIKNRVEPQLAVNRNVEQGNLVQQGQTVRIIYTIKNAGTVDVKNITFSDPGIISEPKVHPFLAVGDTAEVVYSYVADETPRTTRAEITFQYDVGGETLDSDISVADPAVTIDVSVPELVVELTGDRIVNTGDKVDLPYTVTNTSDFSFEQLKITDRVMGDVDSNRSVGPGQSFQGTMSVTVNKSNTFQLTITGKDSTGRDVSYLSNEHTVQTTESMADTVSLDPSAPLDLEIAIEGDRDVIYSEPAEVIFTVSVTNRGISAVQNVSVLAKGMQGANAIKIHEIEVIQPEQTVTFSQALDVSMHGAFQFQASIRGADNKDITVDSNQFNIVYEEPEPIPTPTPEPTPEAIETQPPLPMDQATPPPAEPEERSLGSILLYVLAGLLGVILIAVGVLFILDQRRSSNSGYSGQVKVIDTIQRTPHRDYTRAPKKGGVSRREMRSAPPLPDEEEAAAQPPMMEDEDDYTPTPVAPRASTSPQRIWEDDDDDTEAEPAYDPARMFRRPDADADARPAVEPIAPQVPVYAEDDLPTYDAPVVTSKSLDDEEDEPAPARGQRPSIQDTSVYSRNYLSRIRGEAISDDLDVDDDAGTDDADEAPDLDAPAKAKMSEEEAALLSGSTGQYRLSRKTGSVRGRGADQEGKSPLADAEDPEAFARKQRAARKPKTDLSSFYDDDDEDSPFVRRRR